MFVFGGVLLKNIMIPEKIALISNGKVQKAAGWFWDTEKQVLYVYPKDEIKYEGNEKEPTPIT